MQSLYRLHAAMLTRVAPTRQDRERGDVPGWVLITMMSALLVVALLGVATPGLKGMFQDALDSVRAP